MEINGVNLRVEQSGAGEPLVLVHGSWNDRHSWALVEDDLAQAFRVLSYDRRGHSGSEDGTVPGTRRDDEDDLAALIESLDLGPAHVVGNSYGGSTALGMAVRRPDLVRSVTAHEPPLTALVADDPAVQQADAAFRAVARTIERGDIEAAAGQFVAAVVGPGAWETVPAQMKDTMITNAGTFAAEVRDAEGYGLDLEALSRLDRPVVLSNGDQSPPFFRRIIDQLARAARSAEVVTFPGAGHVPHATHPEEWVALVKGL
jgi:pimeloyl-ACP methyl ester carboxylesterase